MNILGSLMPKFVFHPEPLDVTLLAAQEEMDPLAMVTGDLITEMATERDAAQLAAQEDAAHLVAEDHPAVEAAARLAVVTHR